MKNNLTKQKLLYSVFWTLQLDILLMSYHNEMAMARGGLSSGSTRTGYWTIRSHRCTSELCFSTSVRYVRALLLLAYKKSPDPQWSWHETTIAACSQWISWSWTSSLCNVLCLYGMPQKQPKHEKTLARAWMPLSVLEFSPKMKVFIPVSSSPPYGAFALNFFSDQILWWVLEPQGTQQRFETRWEIGITKVGSMWFWAKKWGSGSCCT